MKPSKAGERDMTSCCGLVLEMRVVFDIVAVLIWLGLNVSLNLYNKWAFSVLGLRIPLGTLALHQFFIFIGLSLLQLVHQCSAGTVGYKPTAWKAPPEMDASEALWLKRRAVFGLSLATAVNYGLNIVALMLLSQADNQVVRATIPLFCLITFHVFEGNPWQGTRKDWRTLGLTFVTVGGAVLTVAAHAQTWSTDFLGLTLDAVSNVASALMMSWAAVFKSKYNANSVDVTWHTALPTGVLVLPFVFLTGEHHIFFAFMAQQPWTQPILFLIIGSLLAMTYSIVQFEIIQRTSSVFVGLAGNFKVAVVILLSELLVQNTRLSGLSIFGIFIVSISFIVGWVFREIDKQNEQKAGKNQAEAGGVAVQVKVRRKIPDDQEPFLSREEGS